MALSVKRTRLPLEATPDLILWFAREPAFALRISGNGNLALHKGRPVPGGA